MSHFPNRDNLMEAMLTPTGRGLRPRTGLEIAESFGPRSKATGVIVDGDLIITNTTVTHCCGDEMTRNVAGGCSGCPKRHDHGD